LYHINNHKACYYYNTSKIVIYTEPSNPITIEMCKERERITKKHGYYFVSGSAYLEKAEIYTKSIKDWQYNGEFPFKDQKSTIVLGVAANVFCSTELFIPKL